MSSSESSLKYPSKQCINEENSNIYKCAKEMSKKYFLPFVCIRWPEMKVKINVMKN